MTRHKDLTGQTFGKLKVISHTGVASNGDALWKCKCDCGVVKDNVRASSLNRGLSKSCGCVGSTKHGMKRTITYNSWLRMKERCNNPKHRYYYNYGGRGIKICEEWDSDFRNFLRDMGLRPGKNYSIERKDSNGDYTKSNCRWATTKEQTRNKRTNVIVETEAWGRLTLVDVAEKSGLPYGALQYRTAHNWPSNMLFSPVENTGTLEARIKRNV